ncbi:MAG: cyclodeaminase/cyclohydrolase family protein [Elusimicrobiaceae bacterium]|nr:cyclodeaminase/cyclohydrolase family protein [Elusimicrobiaceae bacterium]
MQWSTAAEQFVAALASSDPTPGGGAAAAQTAAMGCALVIMAVQTTLKRDTTPADVRARLDKSLKRLGSLKTQLSVYVRKDSEAYAAYLTARKLPKDNPSRARVLQDALLFAARVPADTAATAIEVLKETDSIKDDVAKIIFSDVLCGKHLLQAGIRCAVENIRANLAFIENEDQKNLFEKQIAVFLKSC